MTFAFELLNVYDKLHKIISVKAIQIIGHVHNGIQIKKISLKNILFFINNSQDTGDFYFHFIIIYKINEDQMKIFIIQLKYNIHTTTK